MQVSTILREFIGMTTISHDPELSVKFAQLSLYPATVFSLKFSYSHRDTDLIAVALYEDLLCQIWFLQSQTLRIRAPVVLHFVVTMPDVVRICAKATACCRT